MRNDFLVSKKDVFQLISEDDELEVMEQYPDKLVLWDSHDCKELCVHFLEEMDTGKLTNLIRVSPDIPKEFQFDINSLSEYLWDVCDKNAFLTLNEIVVIWSEEDDSFIDAESKRLYHMYLDEFAYYIGEGVLGQLWFERNIVIINLGEIVRTARDIAEDNNDLYDPYFSFANQLEVGFLTTVLHELRHLQMDTNIFLPEDIYPLNLASEDAVEEYCRNAFEEHMTPYHLFPNITAEEKMTLEQQISVAEDEKMEHRSIADCAVVNKEFFL